MVTISRFGGFRGKFVERGQRKPRSISSSRGCVIFAGFGIGALESSKMGAPVTPADRGFWILPSTLRPEFFGLEHTAELWLGDQALFLFIGITIADAIAFTFFVNPKTYRAFNAEDEVKILWWLSWWK